VVLVDMCPLAVLYISCYFSILLCPSLYFLYCYLCSIVSADASPRDRESVPSSPGQEQTSEQEERGAGADAAPPGQQAALRHTGEHGDGHHGNHASTELGGHVSIDHKVKDEPIKVNTEQ